MKTHSQSQMNKERKLGEEEEEEEQDGCLHFSVVVFELCPSIDIKNLNRKKNFNVEKNF